jgi:hypothetical protein
MEYRFKTLADVRNNLPKDRIDAFILDFREWLKADHQPMLDAYQSILGEVAKALGVQVAIEQDMETFHWVDDGSVGISGITTLCDDKVVGHIKIKREAAKESME